MNLFNGTFGRGRRCKQPLSSANASVPKGESWRSKDGRPHPAPLTFPAPAAAPSPREGSGPDEAMADLGASPKKAFPLALRYGYLTLLLCCSTLQLTAQANALLREVFLASPDRQTTIVRELQSLDRSAYDREAETTLGELLRTESLTNQEDFIKIAGFLGRADLLQLVPEEDRSVQSVRLAINLAKVRAGDDERRDNLLKNLRQIDIDDDFVYAVVPELVYTRDPAIFKYLWELVITENKTCTPADAETPGRIDCAYRIVEYLGSAIEGFPVKIDEDHNLVTNDYAGALAEIRRWYAAHVKDYEIITNTY